MKPRFLLTGVVVSSVLMGSAEARTWLVGGPGADFDQIEPAIDAASDGDLILVRPGIYEHFSLQAKGVMIRASDQPFEVGTGRGVWSDVSISAIPAGLKAGISGMVLTQGTLIVSNSPGEIVLENITARLEGDWLETNKRIWIASCDLVSCTQFHVETAGWVCGERWGPWGNWCRNGMEDPGPTFLIEDSVVWISDLFVRASRGANGDEHWNSYDGQVGGDGIEIRYSWLVLSRPDIHGGGGGSGVCIFEWGGSDGGDGGDAVIIEDSRVLVLGRSEDLIRGGDGGEAGYCSCGACDQWGDGSDGGDGLIATANSLVEVSRVALEGGRAGYGDPPGAPGSDFVGPVSFRSDLPLLATNDLWNPGDTVTIEIEAVEPSFLLLVSADHGGMATLPPFQGPPLSALPGGYFLVTPLGQTDPQGRFVLTGVLPSDPLLQGIAIYLQSVVRGASGNDYLTNATVRVMGE
ncbi:MAG: hypothetical protein AB1486_31055 [Planctomycetota bacterium]